MDKANKIKLILLSLVIVIFFIYKNVSLDYNFEFLIDKINNFDITIIPIIIFAIFILFLINKYNKTFLIKTEVLNGVIYAYKKDKTSFIISQSEVEKISVMRVNQNNQVYYVFKCKLMNSNIYRWKISDKKEKDELLKILENNNFIKKKTH